MSGTIKAVTGTPTQVQIPLSIGLQRKYKNNRYWRFNLSYVYGVTNMVKTEYYLDPEQGYKEDGYVKGLKSFVQLSVMR